MTATAPAGKTCTVTGGSGTASTNVATVAVACVSNPTLSIGGSVSGLVGQGLKLVLVRVYPHQSPNHIDVEALAINQNGTFVFASLLYSGLYIVKVSSQPNAPAQRCVVRTPRIAFNVTADVTGVVVACGEFAYVADATSNTISALSIAATTGVIAAAGPPVSAGLSPYAIAGTSNRAFLYVANSGGNDVSAFAVDAVSGALTGVPGSSVATGANPKAPTIYNNSFLFVLFVANAGSDSLSAYQVDPNSGVPTPLSPASYATGAGPSAMAIDTNSGLASNLAACRT